MGFGALGLAAGGGVRVWRVGVWIADDHGETLRIRRPFVALEASLEFGELPGFAAGGGQKPELAALRLGGRRTRGGEGDPLAVGAPAGAGLAFGAEGELAVRGAVVGGEPDVGEALVLLHVRGGDRVGDGLAVRRALRVAHGAHAGDIV